MKQKPWLTIVRNHWPFLVSYVLIFLIAGWYWYWLQTPQYSLMVIKKALEQSDQALIEEYVNLTVRQEYDQRPDVPRSIQGLSFKGYAYVGEDQGQAQVGFYVYDRSRQGIWRVGVFMEPFNHQWRIAAVSYDQFQAQEGE